MHAFVHIQCHFLLQDSDKFLALVIKVLSCNCKDKVQPGVTIWVCGMMLYSLLGQSCCWSKVNLYIC